MIKAAIFDLDGTLLNTLPSIAWFGNESLRMHGLPSIELDKFRYMVGEGAPLLVERMLADVGADRDKYFDSVYADYRKGYDADTAYLTVPYDGIPELVAKMKADGLKLAVFSNKPQTQVDHVISAFFPEDTFDAIVGARAGLARKPDPEGVFMILEPWNILPEECLYLGDTATDMQTGKAAGCRTLGVSWGFRTQEELWENGADEVVENPEDIQKEWRS